MGHEEVVLEWFPVEAERPTAPAALRARLARLAGLAVPPTRPRRLEEPEHLGLALAPHRADQAEPGSFHYFYNIMPSIEKIFGSL